MSNPVLYELHINGRTENKSIQAWAKMFGVDRSTIYNRLAKGESLLLALTEAGKNANNDIIAQALKIATLERARHKFLYTRRQR